MYEVIPQQASVVGIVMIDAQIHCYRWYRRIVEVVTFRFQDLIQEHNDHNDEDKKCGDAADCSDKRGDFSETAKDQINGKVLPRPDSRAFSDPSDNRHRERGQYRDPRKGYRF